MSPRSAWPCHRCLACKFRAGPGISRPCDFAGLGRPVSRPYPAPGPRGDHGHRPHQPYPSAADRRVSGRARHGPHRHHLLPRQARPRRDVGRLGARSGPRPGRDHGLGCHPCADFGRAAGTGHAQGPRSGHAGPRARDRLASPADCRLFRADPGLRGALAGRGAGDPRSPACGRRCRRALQGGSWPGGDDRGAAAGGTGH